MTVASTITIAYGTAHLISRKLEIGENVICVVEERIPTVMLIPPEDSYNAVKVLWWQARKPLFLGICMSHGKTLPSSALQIRSAKNRESERRLALTSLSDIGNPRYLCNFLAWLATKKEQKMRRKQLGKESISFLPWKTITTGQLLVGIPLFSWFFVRGSSSMCTFVCCSLGAWYVHQEVVFL